MIYVAFFARFTLLLVFIAALVGKVHSRVAWSSFVAATGMLLEVRRTAEGWALATVLAEAATVCCLLLNATAFVGLVLAFLWLAVFLLVVLSGAIRGVQTSCNCFGSNGVTLGWTHVWRNVMLVTVAAVGTGCAAATETPSAFVDAAYATPIALSIIIAALFVMWDDVTFLVVGSGLTNDQL